MACPGPCRLAAGPGSAYTVGWVDDMKHANALVFVVAVALVGAGVAGYFLWPASHTGPAVGPAADKRAWAEPVEKTGLENFHRVSRDLYRGAQPTREGMRQLAAMGIKTVVNLRSVHSDTDEIGDLPLGREHIPTTLWRVTEDDVVRFLRIATDPARLPCWSTARRAPTARARCAPRTASSCRAGPRARPSTR